MIYLAFAIGAIIGVALVVPFVWRTRRPANESPDGQARLTAGLSWLTVLILWFGFWFSRR